LKPLETEGEGELEGLTEAEREGEPVLVLEAEAGALTFSQIHCRGLLLSPVLPLHCSCQGSV
jgi:hypothetical protein